ncbi:MAG: pirin family protein [Xanthobacteraceae bacterium]
MKKKILSVRGNPNQHWVGDGFPVRTLFSYGAEARAVSPFLLLDFAGPAIFPPGITPRGVGAHPHRGFETVTIVYEGEVSHRDSTGQGGTIGPGDVQWMTAAGGILHEEFHSPAYTRSGGPFRMVQLWVNLPAKHKMSQPGYQAILDGQIKSVELPDGAGRARVIAGTFNGTRGPARTCTPINVWDLRLTAGKPVSLDLSEGHTAILVVLSGAVRIESGQLAGEAQMAILSREGRSLTVTADEDATLLVLTGEPIDEPVVGHGPFVMNSQTEIHQAINDFNNGRFGRMPESIAERT